MSFEERPFAGANGERLVKNDHDEGDDYGRGLVEGQQAS